MTVSELLQQFVSDRCILNKCYHQLYLPHRCSKQNINSSTTGLGTLWIWGRGQLVKNPLEEVKLVTLWITVVMENYNCSRHQLPLLPSTQFILSMLPSFCWLKKAYCWFENLRANEIMKLNALSNYYNSLFAHSFRLKTHSCSFANTALFCSVVV